MLSKVGLVGLAFMTWATTEAHAATLQVCQGQKLEVASGRLLCSRTFHASGACDGQDHLAMLKGPDQSSTQLVEPWEAVPITIVGYQIIVFDGALQYALAGNSYTPDIMGGIGNSEISRSQFYPPGTGFAFPASGANAPHLDLHYSCLKNSFQAWYIVSYTLGNDQPAIIEVR
jgi:hypothetical protein